MTSRVNTSPPISNPDTTSTIKSAQDREKLVAERRAKLKALREQGFAYPNDFAREHLAADLQSRYDKHDQERPGPREAGRQPPRQAEGVARAGVRLPQ